MKIHLILIAATSPLFLIGCATTQYAVNPRIPDNSRTIYQDGRETLLSQEENVVALAPTSPTLVSKKRQSFTVAILNRTESDFIFSDKNISATYINHSGKSTVLKIYSYEDLVKEEKRRQAWAAVAAGLQAAGNSMSAASAGYSNTYGTYSANTYSNYGSNYSTYGNYSSTTYNYGAAQAAQNAATAQNSANLSRLTAEGKANLEQLSSSILKKQTVFPNQWFGGMVIIEMPTFSESGTLIFNITTGNEIHSLEFEISEKKN